MLVISRMRSEPVFRKLCCHRKAPVSGYANRSNCPSMLPVEPARIVMLFRLDLTGNGCQDAEAPSAYLRGGVKAFPGAAHSKLESAFMKDETRLPSPPLVH